MAVPEFLEAGLIIYGTKEDINATLRKNLRGSDSNLLYQLISLLDDNLFTRHVGLNKTKMRVLCGYKYRYSVAQSFDGNTFDDVLEFLLDNLPLEKILHCIYDYHNLHILQINEIHIPTKV